MLANGDETALEALYRLYFPRLLVFSYKIVRDNGLAKEVVQNVFIEQ